MKFKACDVAEPELPKISEVDKRSYFATAMGNVSHNIASCVRTFEE
jgi:hypothetical protein